MGNISGRSPGLGCAEGIPQCLTGQPHEVRPQRMLWQRSLAAKLLGRPLGTPPHRKRGSSAVALLGPESDKGSKKLYGSVGKGKGLTAVPVASVVCLRQ